MIHPNPPPLQHERLGVETLDLAKKLWRVAFSEYNQARPPYERLFFSTERLCRSTHLFPSLPYPSPEQPQRHARGRMPPSDLSDARRLPALERLAAVP